MSILKFDMGAYSKGGLFERGGLLKIIIFYTGAKSKWQVDLQDTIDTRYDLYSKSQFLSRNSGSEKTINYFTFFVKLFDI